MIDKADYYVHPLAVVEDQAKIGKGSSVWHFAHIRKNAVLGENCIIGKNVYIDADVQIGSNVKIQNNVSVYHGVTIADGVFVGPHVCFTNDKNPRAINSDGAPKKADDWVISKIFVDRGASIGANATIVAGIRIGKWAMIGSGSVVTKDVPDFALVIGNPARIRGKVNERGEIIERY